MKQTGATQVSLTWSFGQFDAWSAPHLARIESGLDHWVGRGAPQALGDAMRYAVTGGGKRLRPLLVHAAAEAVGGGAKGFDRIGDAPFARKLLEAALRAGCAVELIHAYSLVHDDLPCMDNDVLRRGKPTVHVRYGEAGALLAGDALQALAFELLTPQGEFVPGAVQARLCALLARAAGSEGMAGGQAIDLASVGQALDEPQVQHMHRLKTGALLAASVEMGAACAGVVPEPAALALRAYGAALGLAFQVVDDILDVTADSQTLGKTAGKDAAADKPTYVSLLGLSGARARADALLIEALAALESSELADTAALAALARMIVVRKN